MKCLIPLAAILTVAMAGLSEVSVRLPFLNPAGVTYVGGPAPAGLAAGPYQQPLAAGPYHQPLAAGPYHQPLVAGPYQQTFAAGPYQQTFAAGPYQHSFAAGPYHQPLAYGAPLAHHVAQPVAPVAASVHHVPGVADVPVTHIEATPGVVQKLVDVAHPAVSTRKFHVRRPAIQKQFYDIEERVVVRPAGSALVELDEPLSKEQRGPALISRAYHPVPALKAYHGFPAIGAIHAVHAIPTIPSIASTPSAPSAPSAPASDVIPSSPATSQQPSQDSSNDQDSVSVENPEIRGAQNQQEEQGQQQQQQQQQDQGQQQQDQGQQQPQPTPEQLISNFQSQISSLQRSFTPQFRQYLSEQYEARQFQPDSIPQRAEQRSQPAPQARQQEQQQASQGQTEARFGSLRQEERRSSSADGRSVFPSLRNLDHASSQANQQRLIDLLTARGGVAEVGFGRSGPASGANIEAGGVRARVISATPAPSYADPAGERVSTRRVVVSRPVETLQELDVVEPATKLERVAVNTPTLIKTARLGVARVPTSYPVIQKTYAPAAVPVYGKSLAHPALTYY